MKLSYDTFDMSKSELIEKYGARGEVLYKLIECEGRASWIPEFVNWLFERYDIHLVNKKSSRD